MKTIKVLAAELLLACLVAQAQQTRGTIAGHVSDSSDSAVPNVEVRAINVQTGTTTIGRTNQSGNFVIPFLPLGLHRIEAELAGFKRFARDGVEVRVNETIPVDVKLMAGDVTQSIEVTAQAQLLETNSAFERPGGGSTELAVQRRRYSRL